MCVDPEKILSNVKELHSRQFLDKFKDLYGYDFKKDKFKTPGDAMQSQDFGLSCSCISFLDKCRLCTLTL